MNEISAPAKALKPNRHIVDQLGDVRAEIKVLQARESALKDEISAAMGKADSLGGDEYIASQRLSERKGAIDEKKAALAGIDLDRFRKPPTTVVTLVVERRASEAA